jgi:hypothetical protein
MKTITTIITILLFCFTSQAQTAIGKKKADGAGILDFAAGKKLGIVLPWILNKAGITTPGTLFYDTVTKKVMYRNNTAFIDLSINTGTYTSKPGYVSLTESQKSTIIGSKSSSAEGVVILESNNKALILPKVASPHLNIKNPEPGTICYDTTTKLMCVYNGKEWTFWGK